MKLLNMLLLLLSIIMLGCATNKSFKVGNFGDNRIIARDELSRKDLIRAKALFRVGEKEAAKYVLQSIVARGPAKLIGIRASRLLADIEDGADRMNEKFDEASASSLDQFSKLEAQTLDPLGMSVDDGWRIKFEPKLGSFEFSARNLELGNEEPTPLKRFSEKLKEYGRSKGVQRQAIEGKLLGAIDKDLSLEELAVISKNSDHPSLAEAATIRLAKRFFEEKNFEEARETLFNYRGDFDSRPFKAALEEISRNIRIFKRADFRCLGVVLPLSGQYAPYGLRVLSAIQLALEMPQYFEGHSKMFVQESGGLKLVIGDSMGDPLFGAELVDTLVREHHVVAILGDIATESSLGVARRGEFWGVPTIALSRAPNITRIGPYVLRLGLTPKKQAKALAEYAMVKKGLNRFAILYPRHAYGAEMMRYFWDEVQRRGGEIRAVENYAPKQTTFTEPVKKLLGTFFHKARVEFSRCKKLIPEEKSDAERLREIKKCKQDLTPIVDFDALFIPDFAKTLSYIVPALVAEDILISQNERIAGIFRSVTKQVDVQPIQLLGGSGWNNPLLGERSGLQVDGALFLDGINNASPKFRKDFFVTEFFRLHDTLPTLIEAQAFDAALTLKKSIASENAKRKTSKEELLKRLLGGRLHNGVSGNFSFESDGESRSDLTWMTFEDGKIKAVDTEDNVNIGALELG